MATEYTYTEVSNMYPNYDCGLAKAQWLFMNNKKQSGYTDEEIFFQHEQKLLDDIHSTGS